jgi:hypothetical protein
LRYEPSNGVELSYGLGVIPTTISAGAEPLGSDPGSDRAAYFHSSVTAVQKPVLRTSFAAAAHRSASHAGLPVQLTKDVGRTQECAVR